MTVEFYDLAQRLHAARTGQPVPRVAASLFSVTAEAIFVDSHRNPSGKVAFTVLRSGGRAVTAGGGSVLRALAAAGGVLDTNRPAAQLVTGDDTTMEALEKIARPAARHTDPAVRAASAMVGWWVDRAGYPGTNAVVKLLTHTRQRFITGAVPTRERDAAYWRNEVFFVAGGAVGTEQWARRVSGGPVLAMLAPVREDDLHSHRGAADRFAKGWAWTSPEPTPIASMGLRARCDTADLWEAALLSDRLWRHRAVHTGHVTGGEVVAAQRTSITVSCPHMGSRLRAGSSVVGWIGGVDAHDRATQFKGDVQTAEAHNGALRLTIARVPVAQRPHAGHWVTLMPAPPDTQIVSVGRSRYRNLLFKGDSWIAAGKTPGVRRRDVPLDVLCAAAETE